MLCPLKIVDKMIICKCPFRISLAGGGTDLEEFINKHEWGHVVTFTPELFTYVSLHHNNRGVYIINYTQKEEVQHIQEIKNNLVREVLTRYPVEGLTVTFNSDIISSGSGLASSSSYTVGILKAIHKLLGIKRKQKDFLSEALEIERSFNPLTGRQDIYGCTMGGLKNLYFYQNNTKDSIKQLPLEIFSRFNFWLVPTKIFRSSTSPLVKTQECDLSPLRKKAAELNNAIISRDHTAALEIISDAWETKKQQTPHILKQMKLKKMDQDFSSNKNILSHRLCGAGAGGFFLCITDSKYTLKNSIKIKYNTRGPTCIKV